MKTVLLAAAFLAALSVSPADARPRPKAKPVADAPVASPTPVYKDGPPDTTYEVPHKPYRIADGLYYVGTQGIGVYMIETHDGLIVLDSGTEKGVDLVEANIQALGFKLSDVHILLETHAHWDHVGGMAKLKRDTGATFVASAGDRYGLENGVHVGENHYGGGTFPAVSVDRVINDGDKVKLGGVTMTAHLTPGHTRGDTTWTMDVKDHGVKHTVVFYGSTTVAGNVLVGNNAYPNIVADYHLAFTHLKAIKADILLGNHPEFADQEAKYQAQLAGKTDAFVDPKALPNLVKQSEADFGVALAKEQTK